MEEVREEKRCYTAGFEDGERATSQGMQAASRNWKSKEMDSPLDPAEGTQPADTDFSSLRLILDF